MNRSAPDAPRTLSIGGATYDLFVRVPHEILDMRDGKKAFSLPLGEKVRVNEIIETCGGGASNTSVGLARLGCSAFFAGILADDQWGEKLLTNFKVEGVHQDCITIVEDEVSSYSIILSAGGGERVILYEAGTNTHLHDATFDRATAKSMQWIYLNHIQEDSCVIQDDLTEMLSNDAMRLTWNPGGCQLEVGMEAENNAQLLKNTDLLLVNKEEALLFSKQDTLEAALHTLQKASEGIVCITNGKEGVVASDGKNTYTCPILKDAKPVDTTGAGDAFGTGVTWALLQGETLPTALKAGTINATSVVSAIGAQAGLLTDIEMRKKLETVHLDVVTTSL